MKLDIQGMQETLKNMPSDISELSTTASKPVEKRKQPPTGIALFNAFPWVYEAPITVR